MPSAEDNVLTHSYPFFTVHGNGKELPGVVVDKDGVPEKSDAIRVYVFLQQCVGDI